jgi:peptidoglycan/LPS O-acetylase OafA/YrhL
MGLIRTLLALSVVLAHSPWNHGFALVGGRNAVQLFYMISGFLIAHVLNTNRNYANPMRFYINRGLRIYPTYYVVALLSLSLALLPHSQMRDFYREAGALASVLVAAANVLLFGQDWAMFGAVHHGSLSFTVDFRQSSPPLYTGLLVPQAWTLGLELTFYLLAPLLVRRDAALMTALVLSLLVRAGLMALGIGTTDPWSYRFFPAELSLFLLGALAHRFALPFWRRVLNDGRLHFVPAAAVATMSLVIVVYSVLPLPESVKTVGLMGVFLATLPLAFVYQSRSRIDKRLGDLSYPIYIGHFLMIEVVGAAWRVLHLPASAGGMTAVNVLTAVGFAILLNRLLERPVERIRASIRRGDSIQVA